MYIGVGDAARKVKKGYIGVGGVARLFYSVGPPMITQRLTGVCQGYAACCGNINDKFLLILAPDGNNSSTYIHHMAYNTSLTNVMNDDRNDSFRGLSSLGPYAVTIPDREDRNLTIYDESLTKRYVKVGSKSSSISTGCFEIGNYVLFGTCAVDTALTVLLDLPISDNSGYLQSLKYVRFGAQVGKYLCYSKKTYSPNGTIGTVDTSLTVGVDIKEPTGTLSPTGTAWAPAGDKYAVAVGGDDNGDSSDDSNDKVWAVDGSLTLTSGLTMASRKLGAGSFGLGDYAVFSGGKSTNTYNKTIVDVFDTSLVRTSDNWRSVDSYSVGGGSFAGIGIFYGGKKPVANNPGINNMDVLTI